jgi:hypothetical protein
VIPLATGATYDPPAGLTTTTYYYREATGRKTNGPAAGQYTCIVNTNVISVTVNTLPVVTTTNACMGSGSVTFTQSGGATGGIWTVSGGGTITNAGVFTPTGAGCFTATYTTPAPFCADTKSFVVFPSAPAPVVNSGCGAIIVTPPATVAGFTIQYSFNDGATWGTNTPPTADNCAGYKIKVRYVTSAVCGTIPIGTASTIAGCSESVAVVRVVDNTAPTIGAAGANATIECPATPSFTAPTATDACGSVTVNQLTDITAAGTCANNYTLTRRWYAVDACGNTSSTVSQSIVVRDITAPTIGAAGANATIECTATPSFTAPTASDVCNTATVQQVGADVTGGTACIRTITRTWNAIDACGNTSATRSQTITVVDTQAPTIGAAGANATIECTATPSFTAPTASDVCNTATVQQVGS